MRSLSTLVSVVSLLAISACGRSEGEKIPLADVSEPPREDAKAKPEDAAKDAKDKPAEASKAEAKDAKDAKPAEPDKPFIAGGKVNIVVIADSDMLNDQFWVEVRDFLGQQVAVPNNQPVTTGFTFEVRPAVSCDHRSVSLGLKAEWADVGPTVPLFPVTTFVTPVFEGGSQGQPIPFTQFVQQPVINVQTLEKSFTVGDGGTVLVEAMARTREARTEFGPPVISKIPYINRLFKNIGYGREATSLMIMVTPRIIIPEEEEERLGQTFAF